MKDLMKDCSFIILSQLERNRNNDNRSLPEGLLVSQGGQGRSQQHLLTRDPVTAFSDSDRPERQSQQLELFAAPDTGLHLKIKPQISSIPGISPRIRNRYRVKLGDKILGARLSLDEALKIAKRGQS